MDSADVAPAITADGDEIEEEREDNERKDSEDEIRAEKKKKE
jgi:hypothetical protein